jgi:hypothetical protein
MQQFELKRGRKNIQRMTHRNLGKQYCKYQRSQDFEKGSFSQKSRIFTVNFKDLFLCRGLSWSTSKVFSKVGVVRPDDANGT